eukprot:1458-Eustigmatos_ZCMA.PRE.1
MLSPTGRPDDTRRHRRQVVIHLYSWNVLSDSDKDRASESAFAYMSAYVVRVVMFDLFRTCNAENT